MGTLCHITLSGKISKNKLALLRKEIDASLEHVNLCMSTWQTDTEISQFNAFKKSAPFPISADFAEVLNRALSFSAATGGAFDPTVKPLIDHWGFGPEADSGSLGPIMASVGWQKITVENNSLIKATPALQLDLSAIAKGYGVDSTADVIRANGIENFLVEIGGEIVADGTNRSGNPWRVGIEAPEADKAFGADIFRTVELSGRAMATSGDYRNFQVRDDGSRYSHIIDPHTGRPAESDVAAVSVLAASCTDADAIATALFVMGSEKGLRWVEEHPGFHAFFILHTAAGTFSSKASSGFPESL